MTAATAYCPSNTAFYQHQLATTRSQFTPGLRRTAISPSSSSSTTALTPYIEQPLLTITIKSDENNNNSHPIDHTTIRNIDEILYIISDDDDDDNSDDGDGCDQAVDGIDEEQFLALVGLRHKTKKSVVPIRTLRSLTKRLACPVCLLPLPKYIERVRQALYIRLPSLKFLNITRDIENFCGTDENAKAQSLLPRSVTQTRASRTLNRSQKKQNLPKTAFVNMAANTFRSNTSRTSMGEYVHSILQCQVVLDRLEQSAIEQIMQNSIEDDDKRIEITSTPKRLLRETSPTIDDPLPVATDETTTTTTTTRTTITTMTTEKTIVKRKSTTTELAAPKRFKSIDNDYAIIADNDIKTDSSALIHQRIYLKCFVCSKHEYIDAQVPNSDVLHSHWIEHDEGLSLNIYDSEIDSILTRVVEFFNLPKRHTLEGKIKTVFILNSKEIRCPSTKNSLSHDSYIVID